MANFCTELLSAIFSTDSVQCDGAWWLPLSGVPLHLLDGHIWLGATIDPFHKWLLFKILLYAFKLALPNSFGSKNSFELSTKKRG